MEQSPPEGFGPRFVESDDDLERTTLSSRRSRQQFWTLSLPNGVVELVTDLVILGRSPEFSAAAPSARLVVVPDPTKSMSKNHAIFIVHEGTLAVQDLGSTNGVVVTRVDGREIDLAAGERTDLEAGAWVELGDVVVRVGRA